MKNELNFMIIIKFSNKEYLINICFQGFTKDYFFFFLNSKQVQMYLKYSGSKYIFFEFLTYKIKIKLITN